MATEDPFERLIREVEIARDTAREAYQRGWSDAITAMGQMLAELRSGRSGKIQPSERQETTTPVRRGAVPTAVRQIIEDEPGLTGVGVVQRAQAKGKYKERSIRTALRRLRMDGVIDQRDGRWYLTLQAASNLGATARPSLLERMGSSKEETAETGHQPDSAAPKPDNQGGV